MRITHLKHKFKLGSSKRRTTGVIAIGFLLIILIGTLLLMLPISSADRSFTSPLDAAFTAVSATCVTGLTTVDTATHWSMFGQIVILAMIQIGGLGFMSIAVILSLIIKRAVTPKERMLVAMSYNLDSYGNTSVLLKRIGIGTLCIELAGAIILSTRFIPLFGPASGIYKSIFISISAFCNAGFDLMGRYSGEFSSLSAFVSDPVVNITIMLLILLGGIGFIVWNDIVNLITRKKRLSVYSRFVLIISAILVVGGTAVFAVMEWNNPQTLGPMPTGEKILAATFQAVTLRTAGFCTIDQAGMSQSAQLFSMLLMFIGGCSGSTAGGVKVGTVGVLVYTVWCVALGKKQAVLFRRTISSDSFVRAISVIMVQLTIVLVGTLSVSALSDCGIMSAAYEVFSATDTVGISLGITPSLDIVSKLLLMLLMYLGRVGTLTVTYAVMVNLRDSRSAISYPDANMLIG